MATLFYIYYKKEFYLKIFLKRGDFTPYFLLYYERTFCPCCFIGNFSLQGGDRYPVFFIHLYEGNFQNLIITV